MIQRGFLILVLFAHAGPTAAQEKEKPRIQPDNVITMSVDLARGVSVEDFVKQADLLLAPAKIDWRPKRLQDKYVSFAGTLRIKRSEFLPFFRAMSYRAGVDSRVTEVKGEQHWRIRPLRESAPRISPVLAAKYEELPELMARAKPEREIVLTTLALDPGEREKVASRLAQLVPRGVQFGLTGDGDLLILQGPGDAVLRGIRSVRSAVQPFDRLIPRNACAAAEFHVPAGPVLAQFLEIAIPKDMRKQLDADLRRVTRIASWVDALNLALEERVGLILRESQRSDETKKTFPTNREGAGPEWLLVFHKKRSSPPRARQLIELINQNRRGFRIKAAFKLFLSDRSKVAFEFAIPSIPTTGSFAIADYGDFAFASNSGPFIHDVVQQWTQKTKAPATRRTRDSKTHPTHTCLEPASLQALIQKLERKETPEQLERGAIEDWLKLALGK